MYFDQHEDGEGHGNHSLPIAPSEEQEIKNICILTSTRMEKVTATTLFYLHQPSRDPDLDFSIPDLDPQH
jgi:hypothetical protein